MLTERTLQDNFRKTNVSTLGFDDGGIQAGRRDGESSISR